MRRLVVSAVFGAVVACSTTALPARVAAQTSFTPGTGDRMLQGMVGMMGQFARQFQDSDTLQQWNPGHASGAGKYGGSALDGAWRGSGGEYLLIEGARFRLHADTQRYLDGRTQTRGDLVAFFYPQRQAALVYRYRRNGNQMLLQDDQGNVLRYQRISIR